MTLEQRVARKKAKVDRADERIFLHIHYHPQNPSSGSIQWLWRDLIYSPPSKKTLNQLKNHFEHHVPVKRLNVAYCCNLNLANLNSYCKLSSRTGLKVSSLIWTVLQVSPYLFTLCQRDGTYWKKSVFFDICMEFTGDLLWFVAQIVGQPKPSYRQ